MTDGLSGPSSTRKVVQNGKFSLEKLLRKPHPPVSGLVFVNRLLVDKQLEGR